jgi:transposase
MRTYWRQRNDLIRSAARHVQRMPKALTQMNIQLANVLSEVSGVTGQAIIQAILAGERDPRKLAAFRDKRVKASEEEIARSLEGNWQGDLQFMLKQEQDGYEFCQKQMSAMSDSSSICGRGRIGAREPNYPKRIGRSGSGRRRRISRGSTCARNYFA